MIYALLGVIIGLLFSLIVLVVTLAYREPIARRLKQTESKFKEKGKILEPQSELLEDWINTLPHAN